MAIEMEWITRFWGMVVSSFLLIPKWQTIQSQRFRILWKKISEGLMVSFEYGNKGLL